MSHRGSPLLNELTAYLAALADRCRSARAYEALFGVSVATDIAADLHSEQRAFSAVAYAAQQEDLEAARLLEAAAQDGFSAADLPAVEQAVRLIRKSAERDQHLSNLTRA